MITYLGSNSRLESSLIASFDINEANVSGSSVGWVVSALVILSLVGVTLLGVDATVVLDVLEGVVHQSSVAAIVAVLPAAVDQVLLGEADQLAGGSVMHGLQCSGGGE